LVTSPRGTTGLFSRKKGRDIQQRKEENIQVVEKWEVQPERRLDQGNWMTQIGALFSVHLLELKFDSKQTVAREKKTSSRPGKGKVFFVQSRKTSTSSSGRWRNLESRVGKSKAQSVSHGINVGVVVIYGKNYLSKKGPGQGAGEISQRVGLKKTGRWVQENFAGDRGGMKTLVRGGKSGA